jgi:hypothetical protein
MPASNRPIRNDRSSGSSDDARREPKQRSERNERGSAPSTGRDERLIGAERYPRKGDDDDPTD